MKTTAVKPSPRLGIIVLRESKRRWTSLLSNTVMTPSWTKKNPWRRCGPISTRINQMSGRHSNKKVSPKAILKAHLWPYLRTCMAKRLISIAKRLTTYRTKVCTFLLSHSSTLMTTHWFWSLTKWNSNTVCSSSNMEAWATLISSTTKIRGSAHHPTSSSSNSPKVRMMVLICNRLIFRSTILEAVVSVQLKLPTLTTLGRI